MLVYLTPFEWVRGYTLSLPILAKFAVAMAIIVGVPPLSRRIRLPAVVGLLLSGVILGPYCLDIVGRNRPIADFFAELGKLLLLYYAVLEIDFEQFLKRLYQSIVFGV